MSKREKIIIFLALFAALYGLIDFFLLSSPGKDKDQTGQSEILNRSFKKLAQINDRLVSLRVKTENNERADYLISMIESDWENDPFINLENPVQKINNKNAVHVIIDDNTGLSYSRFIQFDNKILAVINGMEYTTGEHITDTGYKIIKITPDSVVLDIDNRQTRLFLKEE
jgi:hypothetical protein